jgi:hypothetical protein
MMKKFRQTKCFHLRTVNVVQIIPRQLPTEDKTCRWLAQIARIELSITGTVLTRQMYVAVTVISQLTEPLIYLKMGNIVH